MADPIVATPPPRSATDLFSDPLGAHPLWFKPDLFLSPSFDCEAYIAELRTFVPFDTLRSELQSHLTSLKHELIDLINRDYGDFVNLSTKLVDVDAAVVRMRAPLLELREKIEAFRGSVEGSLVALRNGLKQRSEAASAREVLELLLDTFTLSKSFVYLICSVGFVERVIFLCLKVEKLIKELPSLPADWSSGDVSSAERNAMSNGSSLQSMENGTNVRETQSMLLERIASEMNRLKFYIAHAQNLPFIQNMEKRIQSASLLLDASLGHCFVDGLEHRDENAIYNCLYNSCCSIYTENHSTWTIRMVAGAPGDGLQNDYEQIKQHIEADCKFLLEISSTENSGLHVFDFLANSILKEVLSAIQKGKPGAFSPGRPSEFLMNYRSSLEFLAYLEGYCPSRSAVAKFRAQAVYADFMKQWNIGVYFSLREDVLIVSSSDKFLRLCLQLLSRYSSWLSSGLAARRMGNAGTTSGSEWATSAAPDDFVYIIHDINFLSKEVCGNYLEHVVKLLSSCSADVLDVVEQSILQGGKSLNDLAPLAVKAITDALVDKAVEDLRQVKGITATYRMTNKPLPVRHSPYVSGVLRPLKVFLDGERAMTYLTKDTRNELLHVATTDITGRYYELAAELVNVARKTESSLQRIRQGAQRRAGASSDVSDHSVSDTDKICMQLFLDIQEYGRNLSLLGVQAANIPAYRSLWQCVAPTDKQSSISF
ncbi:hypothetical protein K2173_012885 [Erythroxylum novogranatense]|uniref:Conserved oligomeric Golgi complex subunit 2 n=1 Tax=Erythroxylum novogranatense TaxID=1862640 RepID=A0AAV8S7F5_9ROSI|nr:hypothetical protein K2173_012885 [Erythroxylum novogranatense]